MTSPKPSDDWLQKLRTYAKTQYALFVREVKTKKFAKKYAVFSALVLLATTIAWSLLGASVHRSNADQLVGSFLFDSPTVFHQAFFPAAHTFLLKWPLFWLSSIFGLSGFILGLFTVILTLLSVGCLAVIFYKQQRLLMFGTLCLALASTLFLVPAQPYFGGLLPVNMAMVTTRNLEYVIYILSLLAIIKSPSLLSRNFWLSVFGLSVLFISDKLFLSMSLAGALLSLIVYSIARQIIYRRIALFWLLSGLVAAAIATIFLAFVNGINLTHITHQGNASPYSFMHSPSTLALGLIYGLLGLLTNFGANPAFDATIVRQIPEVAWHRLFDVSGLSFLINLGLLGIGSFIVWRATKSSLFRVDKKHTESFDSLSITLIWSSVAAILAFIITDHYFAVDARYLTIAVFAIFITASSYLRYQHFSPQRIVLIGVVIVIGIGLAAFSIISTHDQQARTLETVDSRNALVTQALKNHPVDTLLGDYWRVIPIKLASHNTLDVTPLANCFQDRDTLTSQNWQSDLRNHSFAYLISFDKSLTDFPQCNLSQIEKIYGKPNSSTLIAGKIGHPDELLLFYDHGTRGAKANPNAAANFRIGTVLPTTLDKLSRPNCNGSFNIFSVVAHEDDDLLFANPSLQQKIGSNSCIRTVYLTAGDAGGNQLYWQSRERGSEAAYSLMSNADRVWVERTIKLAENRYITIANPRGDPKISLIFFRLADGNLRGEGFKATDSESLAKFRGGSISKMHSVDKQSEYDSEELINTILTLMDYYSPNEVRSQAPYNLGGQFPDHSDHVAAGQFARDAFERYKNKDIASINYYVGYPVRQFDANVSGADLDQKSRAFDAYNDYDPGTCQDIISCQNTPTYGSYLARQYTTAELGL